MRELSLSDWSSAAKELRSAAFVSAAGVRHDGGTDRFLRKLESVPSVVVVSGECDASALALLATATLGFVTDDVAVSVDADTVLALGLTSSLPAAVGAVPARALLFGGTLDAAPLRDSGLARRGDPAAARVDSPGAALVVRSLRVAARSTAEQAREYDAELRQLS
ncbi:hypothetical protein [Actinophytocola oryzae]|uniref:Uncharacterized protein n=1 Tax=Actinophytocola oryzae TaxID=502181 RepID=A0A4R7W4B8_9PSEU|nr:hypothetical protein [Actinophytocola oryzae]TDV57536.1 hypothetical protein CLV71_101407 [Actinophytocola oryzae]